MSHRKDQRLIKSARGKAINCCKIPDGIQFVWMPRAMLESVAFRALSGNSRKALDRLSIELLAHAGTENGNLITTHNDFADYGIRYPSIAEAIRQLEYMGLIRVKKGWAYSGEHTPSLYRLTWLKSADGLPATNEWVSITESHIKAYRFKVKSQAQIARKNRLKKKQNASLPDNVVKIRLKGADNG